MPQIQSTPRHVGNALLWLLSFCPDADTNIYRGAKSQTMNRILPIDAASILACVAVAIGLPKATIASRYLSLEGEPIYGVAF